MTKSYSSRYSALCMFANTFYTWKESLHERGDDVRDYSGLEDLKTLKHFRKTVLQFGVDEKAFVHGINNILLDDSFVHIRAGHSPVRYFSSVVKLWNPSIVEELLKDGLINNRIVQRYFYTVIPDLEINGILMRDALLREKPLPYLLSPKKNKKKKSLHNISQQELVGGSDTLILPRISIPTGFSEESLLSRTSSDLVLGSSSERNHPNYYKQDCYGIEKQIGKLETMKLKYRPHQRSKTFPTRVKNIKLSLPPIVTKDTSFHHPALNCKIQDSYNKTSQNNTFTHDHKRKNNSPHFSIFVSPSNVHSVKKPKFSYQPHKLTTFKDQECKVQVIPRKFVERDKEISRRRNLSINGCSLSISDEGFVSNTEILDLNSSCTSSEQTSWLIDGENEGEVEEEEGRSAVDSGCLSIDEEINNVLPDKQSENVDGNSESASSSKDSISPISEDVGNCWNDVNENTGSSAAVDLLAINDGFLIEDTNIKVPSEHLAEGHLIVSDDSNDSKTQNDAQCDDSNGFRRIARTDGRTINIQNGQSIGQEIKGVALQDTSTSSRINNKEMAVNSDEEKKTNQLNPLLKKSNEIKEEEDSKNESVKLQNNTLKGEKGNDPTNAKTVKITKQQTTRNNSSSVKTDPKTINPKKPKSTVTKKKKMKTKNSQKKTKESKQSIQANATDRKLSLKTIQTRTRKETPDTNETSEVYEVKDAIEKVTLFDAKITNPFVADNVDEGFTEEFAMPVERSYENETFVEAKKHKVDGENSRNQSALDKSEARRLKLEEKRLAKAMEARRQMDAKARSMKLQQDLAEDLRRQEEERKLRLIREKEEEEARIREKKRLAEEEALRKEQRLERQREEQEKMRRKMSLLIAEREAEARLRQAKEKLAAEIEEELRRKEAEMLEKMSCEQREKYLLQKQLEEQQRRIAEEKRQQQLKARQLLEENERQRKLKELEELRKRLLCRYVNDSYRMGNKLLTLAQAISRAFTYSYFQKLPHFVDSKKVDKKKRKSPIENMKDMNKLPSLAELMEELNDQEEEQE